MSLPAPVNSTVSVALTSTLIAPANSGRKSLVISNPLGGTAVWLSFGAAAVMNQGWLLNPGDVLYLADYMNTGGADSLRTWDVYGITITAPVNVGVVTN